MKLQARTLLDLPTGADDLTVMDAVRDHVDHGIRRLTRAAIRADREVDWLTLRIEVVQDPLFGSFIVTLAQTR